MRTCQRQGDKEKRFATLGNVIEIIEERLPPIALILYLITFLNGFVIDEEMGAKSYVQEKVVTKIYLGGQIHLLDLLAIIIDAMWCKNGLNNPS